MHKKPITCEYSTTLSSTEEKSSRKVLDINLVINNLLFCKQSVFNLLCVKAVLFLFHCINKYFLREIWK